MRHESLYAEKIGQLVSYWEGGEMIDAIVLRVLGDHRDLVFVREDTGSPIDDDEPPYGRIMVRFNVPACSAFGRDADTPPCWEDD